MRTILLSRPAGILAIFLACALAANLFASLALGLPCTNSCPGDQSNSTVQNMPDPCMGWQYTCVSYVCSFTLNGTKYNINYPYCEIVTTSGVNWATCVSGGTGTCSWKLAQCATVQQYYANCSKPYGNNPQPFVSCVAYSK